MYILDQLRLRRCKFLGEGKTSQYLEKDMSCRTWLRTNNKLNPFNGCVTFGH